MSLTAFHHIFRPNTSRALFLLFIPLGFLSLFLFGEIFEGDISGLSHLLQIIPLLLLGYLAIKYPKPVGLLFIIIGSLGSAWYFSSVGLLFFPVHPILFWPLILSGYLLRRQNHPIA